MLTARTWTLLVCVLFVVNLIVFGHRTNHNKRDVQFKSSPFHFRSRQRDTCDHCPTSNITIAVLGPSNDSYPYALPKILPAIVLAVRSLQNNNNFPNLRNKTIHVIHQDTQCSSTLGPLAAFELSVIADVFMGPECPYVLAPVARYSPAWNVSVA